MGLVRTIAEGFTSPEIVDRGILSEIPHPAAGTVPNIAAPFRLEGTPLVDPVAASMLYHRTSEHGLFLGFAAWNEKEIDRLAARGAFDGAEPAAGAKVATGSKR